MGKLKYAVRHGYDVVMIYSDEAQTGTNADRVEFQKMIHDSGKSLFDTLIIHKLDRFSRDRYDAVTYKRKLKLNGITLISVLENLDGSPESVIMESLLEGMAQYYSQNLAREVMKGLKEAAYRAVHLGGTPPLGYDLDKDRHYIINEAEAEIVRKIFTMYADGVGYLQILLHLNGMGYKTKRGQSFGKGSLNTILKNLKYVGDYVFNKKLEKDITGKRRPQFKPESEWVVVKDGMPAIIDRDTFDKVQLKIAENLKSGGKFKSKELYLLSGLVYCGICGYALSGNTRYCGRGKSKYSSYRCSSRIQKKHCDNKELRKEYLDNYVLDELYKRLFSENSIKKLSKMLTEYNHKQSESNKSELNRVANELTSVSERISKVIHLVSESGISIETIKDELKQLEERKQYLSAYFNELSLKNRTSLITEEMILDLINKSKEFVKTKNIAECRNFITNYVEKVVVYNEHVEIIFKINVPDDDNEAVIPLKSEEAIKTLQKEYKVTSLI